MRGTIIHGLCRGKQSAWLSANRTKSGCTRNPYNKNFNFKENQMRKRNISIPIRVTEKELSVIDRKAAWMLQNGIIPCEIRNTPTHKCTIRKEDVLAYMAKSEREKRKEIPVGIFNAKKTNNPRRTESPDSDCGGYFDDTNYKLRGKERARFKEMLEDLLSAVHDTLTVDEVAELTGYHRRTILRYVQRKYIYAVNIMGKYYISKQSIINYLATDKAFKNTQKSEWHEEIIKTYI